MEKRNELGFLCSFPNLQWQVPAIGGDSDREEGVELGI